MAAISNPPSPLPQAESEHTAMYSDSTVTVLDWDDTLIPSTWLKEQGLTGAALLDKFGITKEMVDACEEVAPYVQRVIQKAQEYGKVFIITNGTHGWVENSCGLFMPSIRNLVLSLPIISAADLYRYFSKDPISWKRMAFRRDLLDRAFGGMPRAARVVISIGDGYAEQQASRNLMMIGSYSQVGLLSVRSLKIVESSSPAVLIRQLDEICQVLPSLATQSGDFDLQWNTVPLAKPVAAPIAPVAKTIAPLPIVVTEPEEKKQEEEDQVAPYIKAVNLWSESYIRALFPTLRSNGLLVVTELPQIKRTLARSVTPALGARYCR
ncbi:MAG: hypothetical protein EBU84_07300 [Actinobacteria bacterium]|nr:hypothetical protein [Actinomycetota bacterium]